MTTPPDFPTTHPKTQNPTPETHRDGLLIHLQALLEITIVATFIAAFIIQPFRIPSESMQPTLLVGDFLLGNKQAFAPSGFLHQLLPPTTIHRGDLVLFHYPPDPSRHLVKRVIGLPGDLIHLSNGIVYLNGIPQTEPYAAYTPSPHESFRDEFPSLRHTDPNIDPAWWIQLRSLVANNEITVPANHYFVLGDNRNNSEDSRYWGFVSRDEIVGRPFIVYLSAINKSHIPHPHILH